MRRKCPQNIKLFELCRFMVAMATRNAILKNGGVYTKSQLLRLIVDYKLGT